MTRWWSRETEAVLTTQAVAVGEQFAAEDQREVVGRACSFLRQDGEHGHRVARLICDGQARHTTVSPATALCSRQVYAVRVGQALH